MNDSRLVTLGIVVTVMLHAAIVGGVVYLEKKEQKRAQDQAAFDFSDAQTVEASLAFKKRVDKSKQPQKKKNVAPPPEVLQGVSHDENKVPTPPKPEDPKQPKPPKSNIADILNKNRAFDPDDEVRDKGVDDPNTSDSDEGSQWGTEKEAKGDKYVGEMRGRIYNVWKVPSLEAGAGWALGCVRLDDQGKIVDRKLWKSSGNGNLDRSVEDALREATSMEEPVPDYLINLLTKKGICFRFKLGD